MRYAFKNKIVETKKTFQQILEPVFVQIRRPTFVCKTSYQKVECTQFMRLHIATTDELQHGVLDK